MAQHGFRHVDWKSESSESLDQVLSATDLCVLGHDFLSDDAHSDTVNRFPIKQRRECRYVFFLNKEYVNLKRKLEYIQSFHRPLIISHHWDAKRITRGIDCYHMPFGCSSTQPEIDVLNSEKDIDIFFSGLLRNRRYGFDNNFRIEVIGEIYHLLNGIPLAPRRQYRQYTTLINAIPESRVAFYIAKFLRKYRYLQPLEFYALQARSKLFISTLSPARIIGPRYVEAFSAGARVLSEPLPRELPKDYFGPCRVDEINNRSEVCESVAKNLREFDISVESVLWAREHRSWSSLVASLIKSEGM